MGEQMKKSPLVRKSDPQTSRDAAKAAAKFKRFHILRIFMFLECNKSRVGWTPRQIAAAIRMDYVAVQRRAIELVRHGLIIRGPEKREGQRVWRLAK